MNGSGEKVVGNEKQIKKPAINPKISKVKKRGRVIESEKARVGGLFVEEEEGVRSGGGWRRRAPSDIRGEQACVWNTGL